MGSYSAFGLIAIEDPGFSRPLDMVFEGFSLAGKWQRQIDRNNHGHMIVLGSKITLLPAHGCDAADIPLQRIDSELFLLR